ncbi:MAG TPA: protease modulator HflC [Phycisphaerae bacterium]|nr:protease modulator HflC [Phycisphaerae bacterium]
MRRTIVWLLIVALVLLTVWSMLFSVDETQYAIVTRFGNPKNVIEQPGLNWKLPAPIETVVYFDNRLLVLDQPGPGEPPPEFLTLDKKNIEVACYTCWKIKNEQTLRFLETVGSRDGAEAALGDVVAAELGRVLGEHNLTSLLSINPDQMKIEQIMQEIRDTCDSQARQEYGIEVVDFKIKRINFPEQNRQSVFQRMRAERKRIATRYRSEGEEEAAKIRAQADKTRTEILAQAKRESQEITGTAEAQATRIYAEAFGQDTEFYEFLRTIESYEKSLTAGTTIILPADSPYLRLLNSIEAIMGSHAPPTPTPSVETGARPSGTTTEHDDG